MKKLLLLAFVLNSSLSMLSQTSIVDFAPWDVSKYPDYYDAAGKLKKPIPLEQNIIFAKRSTPWSPELSPEWTSYRTLFYTSVAGVTIDGNGLVVDMRTPNMKQPLEYLYKSNLFAENYCRGYDLKVAYNASVTKPTILKNIAFEGCIDGLTMGNPGWSHELIVDNCTFSRCTWAVYSNGSNTTFKNCKFLETGSGIYMGSKSRYCKFYNNTFRDGNLTRGQSTFCNLLFDSSWGHEVVGNTFEKSLLPDWPDIAQMGISMYRNGGEDNNLREDITQKILVKNNVFKSCNIGVHIASRMGRNVSYDVTQEGTDYAFYNSIEGNTFIDCEVGIKINNEANTVKSNTFTNTKYPIALNCVLFSLKNIKIIDQSKETVHLWYTQTDYNQVKNHAFLFDYQDNINSQFSRDDKKIFVSTEGTAAPTFYSKGGYYDKIFSLNQEPAVDKLLDHRFGSPITRSYGDFQWDIDGKEVIAIWKDKTSKILDKTYYSIYIFDENGTEINRCGRSEDGYSQAVAGYFMRSSGEMEIAAVPKTAINGKYPVYIFRRGFKDAFATWYPENTDSTIRIGTDANHKLIVSFGKNCSIIPYARVSTQAWEEKNNIAANENENVEFGPQHSQYGTVTTGWKWYDPKGNLVSQDRYFVLNNIKYDQRGVYVATHISQDGCPSDIQYFVDVKKGNLLSITDFNKNKTLYLYPNPTSNIVNIETDLVTDKAFIEISDLTGKIISSQEIFSETQSSFKSQVNMSAFPRGVYLLKLDTEKGKSIGKIIKL